MHKDVNYLGLYCYWVIASRITKILSTKNFSPMDMSIGAAMLSVRSSVG